jgi:hypothetical protein
MEQLPTSAARCNGARVHPEPTGYLTEDDEDDSDGDAPVCAPPAAASKPNAPPLAASSKAETKLSAPPKAAAKQAAKLTPKQAPKQTLKQEPSKPASGDAVEPSFFEDGAPMDDIRRKQGAGARRKKDSNPTSLWVRLPETHGVIRWGSLSAGVTFQCDDGPHALADEDKNYLMSFAKDKKKPPNDYAIFVQERRKKKKKSEDGTVLPPPSMVDIGEEWRNLPAEERKKFTDRAEALKREMLGDEKPKKGGKKRAEPDADGGGSDGEDGEEDEGAVPSEPKKPRVPSAFILFMQDSTSKLQAQGLITKKDIKTECRTQWNLLSADGQAEYKKRSKELLSKRDAEFHNVVEAKKRAKTAPAGASKAGVKKFQLVHFGLGNT